MSTKIKGISRAARDVGCCEQTLRRLEARRIVQPIRDAGGRRRFGEDDVRAARLYLSVLRRSGPQRHAADES
ncbi:MAG: MerR family transcriptional regulator [Steroidobacteraceae bacterium]